MQIFQNKKDLDLEPTGSRLEVLLQIVSTIAFFFFTTFIIILQLGPTTALSLLPLPLNFE